MKDSGKKEVQQLHGNFGMPAGGDSLNIPSTFMADLLDLRFVKDFLVSLKREVERRLARLEVVQIPYGPRNDNTMCKPTSWDKDLAAVNEVVGLKGLGPSVSRVNVGLSLTKSKGPDSQKPNGEGADEHKSRKGEVIENAEEKWDRLERRGCLSTVG